jgi:cytochrome c oxidase subunit 4
MSSSTSHVPLDERHEGEHFAHVVPLWILFATFGALMLLTVLTVAAVAVDLGELNIWIAMGIATMKAAAVVLWFMHLAYDRPFNQVIFLSTLFFVGLLLAFVMVDSAKYQGNVEAWQAKKAADAAAAAPAQ